jgi:hypothetical protein
MSSSAIEVSQVFEEFGFLQAQRSTVEDRSLTAAGFGPVYGAQEGFHLREPITANLL